MEYKGSWKEIWYQKGLMEGTKEDIIIYDGWEKSSTSMEYIANKIKKQLDIKQEDKVLEIGCGAGGLARFFDCDYCGVDFSESLVEKCIQFFGKKAIYAEANRLPFADKSFDKCFSWGVFLYFPNMEYMQEVVSEMKRVSIGSFFIGDCPMKSHDNKHMIYTRDDFEKLGLKTMDGWSHPYENERFNAFYNINNNSSEEIWKEY